MSKKQHDPLCPQTGLTVLQYGCPSCERIRDGRNSAIESALATIRYEFPKPTLGVQKIIRILEGMVEA